MSQAIDLKDALERVQDDKELLCELFDIFVDDFPAKRDKIWTAFTKGDCASFQAVAHGFKGATGNVSAAQMHKVCVELDRMGKQCDIAGAGPLLEELDKHFADFKSEVIRLKQEFGK